jgi:phosphatidylglycerol:prolipoprotein diacylglycerol transferase
MDFLRIRGGEGADPRYAGLTPAQWACVALFLFGLYLLRLTYRLKAQGIDPADMVKLKPPKRDDVGEEDALAT